MSDLIQEFFKRDLSDPEFEALAAGLDSEAEALRFAEEASRFQQALGAAAAAALALKLAQAMKAPGWGALSASGVAAKGLAVKTLFTAAALALAAGGVYVARQQWVPHAETAVPAPSLTAPASKSGSEILLKLQLREGATVHALVRDSRGETVRDLGERSFEAGRHSWAWDGLDERGQALPPGRYQVLLRYNGKEAQQWVQVRRAH